ncbi:MAG: SCO family protein [Gammaproteobacteria bacterium]|nr:SCO family protein [Gammaproteobacteria bacterium]
MKSCRLLAAVLTALLAYCTPAFAAEMPDSEAAPSGGDFVLQSADGPVALRDLRGKVVLLTFGYSYCPDVCPISLGYLSRSLDGLQETEQVGVSALFISVDPERDTLQHLAEFVRYFHSALIGVTGSEAELAEVAGRYGVKYYHVKSPLPGQPYSISHSAATYLVNPDGQLQFIFPYETPPGVITEAIRHVQQQRQQSAGESAIPHSTTMD